MSKNNIVFHNERVNKRCAWYDLRWVFRISQLEIRASNKEVQVIIDNARASRGKIILDWKIKFSLQAFKLQIGSKVKKCFVLEFVE